MPIYAVDPHEVFIGMQGGQFGPEDRAAFFRAMLRTSSYKAVRLINLSSDVVTKGWVRPISVLWIDGDHTYEGVKLDFESWRPHLRPDAKIAFDDSLDPGLGPSMLIDELVVQNGYYGIIARVGKITVIAKPGIS